MPGPGHWLRDTSGYSCCIGRSCNSDLTPGPGTSICHSAAIKKKIKIIFRELPGMARFNPRLEAKE